MCPTLMPYGLISVYRSTMASLVSMTRLDWPPSGEQLRVRLLATQLDNLGSSWTIA
jgi:hypothetical protein